MDTFFDSVARAFEGNRQALPQVQLAILVLLALLVVLQLAVVVRRLLARRSRFQQLLATRGVSADDRRFARRLAAWAEVEPLALVTQLDLFERATAQALAPEAPEEAAAAAPRIRRLRHALGYDRLPSHTPLLSTRELTRGTALDVAAHPGTVIEVDELSFTVEVRDPPSLPTGDQAALALTHAREARYALGCRLVAAHPTGGRWHLRFEHDEGPVRQQQREYARVPVDAAVALRPETSWQGMAAPAGDAKGKLVDLSGGGAKVVSPVALPVGSLVNLSFRVGRSDFDALLAVVLSCQPEADGLQRLQLEFTGGTEAERERLVAALTQLELQLKAAARSAGVEAG